MQKIRNINGTERAFYYDDFGNLSTTVLETGIKVSTNKYWTLGSNLPNALYEMRTTTTGKPEIRKFYDVQGNVLRNTTGGFNGDIAVDYQYSTEGLLLKQSLPYYLETQSPNFSSFEYDPETKSLKKEIYNGRTTTYTREVVGNDLITTTVKPNNKVYKTYSNSLGESYKYIDELGNTITTSVELDKVTTNASGLISTNYFDTFGNLIKKEDPSLGVTVYNKYDAAGRILELTNPNGIKSVFTYDVLGRMNAENVGGNI